jgi:hypothetical protein
MAMTNYAEILTRALGAPRQATAVSPEDLELFAGKVPAPLLDLWREHGWAGYGDGLFWTIDPRDVEDLLPSFLLIPEGSTAFGRDAFANLYLSTAQETYEHNVHVNEAMVVASSLDLFFEACIDDVDFRKSYMWSDLFAKALKRLGPLNADECYAPFPALAAGGSLAVKSLKRVKYHEQLEILAQLHG